MREALKTPENWVSATPALPICSPRCHWATRPFRVNRTVTSTVRKNTRLPKSQMHETLEVSLVSFTAVILDNWINDIIIPNPPVMVFSDETSCIHLISRTCRFLQERKLSFLYEVPKEANIFSGKGWFWKEKKTREKDVRIVKLKYYRRVDTKEEEIEVGTFGKFFPCVAWKQHDLTQT